MRPTRLLLVLAALGLPLAVPGPVDGAVKPPAARRRATHCRLSRRVHACPRSTRLRPKPKPKRKPSDLAPAVSGAPPLTDAAAAAMVQQSSFEPRPDNAVANATMPTDQQLAYFRSQDDMSYAKYVTGHYTGTTDQVIQWAARKWSLDPDLVRAVAAVESWWHMGAIGDNGDSFGMFQIRRPYHCCPDLAAGSTAFSADYYGALIRAYLDGTQTWLNSVSGNGRPYTAGDLWGSVGAWASGRWHDGGATAYVARVQAEMAARPWLGQSF